MMLIVSNIKAQICNLENVTNIHYNNQGDVFASCLRKDGDTLLGSYKTTEFAHKALIMLARRIEVSKNPMLVYMPTYEQVEIAVRGECTPLRSQTGKKSKGHGGS